MAFPSRPSLTGLSQPPTLPELEPKGEDLVTWRLVALGTMCGFLPSFAVFFPVVGAEAQRPATIVVAVMVSSVLALLLLLGVGAGMWGALGWAVNRKQTLRLWLPQWGAALGVGAAVVTYLLMRGAGEAFRLSSGQTIGLGSCEFVWEGADQLLWPLLVEYRHMGLTLLAGAAVAWGLAVWLLSRPIAQLPSYSKLLFRSSLSWSALLLIVYGLSSSNQANDEQLAVTADLSFLLSWAERGADNGPMPYENDESVSGTVRPGPLREGETAFESNLLRLDPRKRPNVILVMLESVGVNHLGYMGYSRSTTPELDSLARESLNFTSVRTTATHSNYAQMAVLSSLFPRRYAGLDTYRRLDYPRVLWHDVLGQLGYTTATFSSQDERWQGMLRFEQTQFEHPIFHAANYTGRKALIGSERTVPDEVTVRRAVAWLERQKVPFGLYLNFQSTHFPYVVPESFPKPFLPDQPARGRFHFLSYPAEDRPLAINRYDNALAYVDQQLGVLRRALKRLRLEDSTILIITSDHGELFGEHDTVTHGRTLFEAEARVPLLIRYPAGLRPRRDERNVSTLDVMPTLLGLLGIPPHPSYQGIDVLGAGYDKNRPILMNIQGMRSREGVICGEYKYTRSPTGTKAALFHLSSDPEETSNLMDQEPALATQLDRFLSAHMRAQMAYYRPGQTSTRSARFAPRFGSCVEPVNRGRFLEHGPTTQ